MSNFRCRIEYNPRVTLTIPRMGEYHTLGYKIDKPTDDVIITLSTGQKYRYRGGNYYCWRKEFKGYTNDHYNCFKIYNYFDAIQNTDIPPNNNINTIIRIRDNGEFSDSPGYSNYIINTVKLTYNTTRLELDAVYMALRNWLYGSDILMGLDNKDCWLILNERIPDNLVRNDDIYWHAPYSLLRANNIFDDRMCGHHYAAVIDYQFLRETICQTLANLLVSDYFQWNNGSLVNRPEIKLLGNYPNP